MPETVEFIRRPEEPADLSARVSARPSEMNILSGTVELFSNVDPNGYMWDGDGDREVRKKVTFDIELERQPIVIPGIVSLDSSQGQNLRFNLTAEDVTKKGFSLVFRTWSDTRIASCAVSWLAIAQNVESRLRMIEGSTA